MGQDLLSGSHSRVSRSPGRPFLETAWYDKPTAQKRVVIHVPSAASRIARHRAGD